MLRWAEHLKGGGPEGKHHAAVVATGSELYAFGGRGGISGMKGALMDVSVFNTVSLRWTKLPQTARGERRLDVPASHWGHTAALIDDMTVYVWGGFPYCNVLYAFDVDTHGWFRPRVSGTVPEERYKHSACVSGKVMFVHGGHTRANYFSPEYRSIHKLDTSTMAWSLLNTSGSPPPASECHSATVIGTKMFVFTSSPPGYWTGHFNRLCIRVFDTETNDWLSKHPTQDHPGQCKSHSAFTYKGELYICADDVLWRFNPETFSWRLVEPKGKRGQRPNYRRCCCVVGDRVFFLGGHTLVQKDASPTDLYVLDFSPSLKTLCKLAVIQNGLEQSGLTHNIRWELAAMTSNSQ